MVELTLSEYCIESSANKAFAFISKFSSCPLCPPGKSLKRGLQKHFISVHFLRAVDIVVSEKAVSCLPCSKNCLNKYKSNHFHCCLCSTVITRRFNFKRHLELCSKVGKQIFLAGSKQSDDETLAKFLKSNDYDNIDMVEIQVSPMNVTLPLPSTSSGGNMSNSDAEDGNHLPGRRRLAKRKRSPEIRKRSSQHLQESPVTNNDDESLSNTNQVVSNEDSSIYAYYGKILGKRLQELGKRKASKAFMKMYSVLDEFEVPDD
ncbi:uncharacterized protein LOC143461101 [Clavelina lepadiformis]|uniref:Uncharacterized protein n=1 Tax=Clavelina lepadiformis TaxID=159417 RepID=A0ABP0GB45_CLALP